MTVVDHAMFALGRDDFAQQRHALAALAASINAAMFDPRPEIRMATRRFMVSPRQIEMTVINHAMLALGRDHFAQQCHGLTALSENGGDLGDRI